MKKMKTRLDVAFASLRRQGLITKRAFLCCCGCAGYAIADQFGKMAPAKRERVAGCVFYTRQDERGLDHRTEPGIYLAFGSITHTNASTGTKLESTLETIDVGMLVALALREAGIEFEWDGDPSVRIWMEPNAFEVVEDEDGIRKSDVELNRSRNWMKAPGVFENRIPEQEGEDR